MGLFQDCDPPAGGQAEEGVVAAREGPVRADPRAGRHWPVAGHPPRAHHRRRQPVR